LFAQACTISHKSKTTLKNLVDPEATIFDKRFKEYSINDINLKHFWVEGISPSNRDPVPLTNKTFSDVAQGVKDGVVNIYTLRVEERETKFGISPNDLLPIKIPILSTILEIIPFQVPIPFRTQGISLGSGFIINAQGYILTNAHVIHNATDIRVILSEGKKDFPAKIIGVDSLTDLALIKIDADYPLTPLPLGDSDLLPVGEVVLAMGNPMGLAHTMTSGVVSAMERIVPNLKDHVLDFIQTDSAINPGNSGGPLLNLYGEVVGINTAILAEAQLIGFAIPVSVIKEVMPLLVVGKTERGWFGAAAHPLTIKDTLELGFTGDFGVMVTEISKGSPAEKVGLKERDVIVKFNNQKIRDFLMFRRKLLGLAVGQKINFDVFRKGKIYHVISKLIKKPTIETPPS
jgi:serine protease Do